MTFAHVADAKLRSILEQESCDEDSICYALEKTMEAIEADKENSDVTYEVWNARNEAYEDADDQWNQEGNAAAAIESLKECWRV